jgi:Fe-S-cluster-containing hydrogenase component 2
MTELHGPFIMVNPERCVGCHTCEMACAVAHTRSGSLVGAMLSGEPLVPRDRVLQVGAFRFPAQCRQCEDAPCVKVCPTGATFRTETYTAVNPSVCIGCRMCMMVCPFGAIRITVTAVNGGVKRAAVKCDLCVNRPAGPACIEACPTHALTLAQPQQVVESALKASAQQFLEALSSQQRQAKL